MASLRQVKRLDKGAYVIVQRRFRRVEALERRKQGIGVKLQPVHRLCGPKIGDAEWVMPCDVHIPGTRADDNEPETDDNATDNQHES